MIPISQKWKNEGNLLKALTENLSQPDEQNYQNQRGEQNDLNKQKDPGRGDDLSQQNLGGLDERLVISETPPLEDEEQQQQKKEKEKQQHTASSEASSSKALKKPPSHDGPGDEEGTCTYIIII